ncbi:c-type cytochrome [Natronohydrobacter thiooxidans]|uniref:c-type cytochrome n=1 Tax=Natronohydrobacter thiooxidans TaxID=87172 RepID=UPI000B024195|nr:c-type cytochrome [Natronohydrobacter thiooxidans]
MGRVAIFASIITVSTAVSATSALSDDAVDMQDYYAAECSQCHGRAARGMASFPSLRGKTAELLAERLESYRAGEAVGPNSMLMFPIAKDLSDEMIENLSAYIAENFG